MLGPQTVALCEGKCCLLDGCLAFAWIANTGQCHLKNKSIPSNFHPGSKGTTCGILPGNPTPPPGPSPGPPPGPAPPRPPAPPMPAPTPGPPDPAAPRPHFLFILQDDMGYDDAGFNNPASVPYSAAITQLATDGIRLTNHYVYGNFDILFDRVSRIPPPHEPSDTLYLSPMLIGSCMVLAIRWYAQFTSSGTGTARPPGGRS